jgi:hypothetical protein
MAQFTVKIRNAERTANEEYNLADELALIELNIFKIQKNLSFSVKSKSNIQAKLHRAEQQVAVYRGNMKKMYSTLDDILSKYDNTEIAILKGNVKAKTGKALASKEVWSTIGSVGILGNLTSAAYGIATADNVCAAWVKGIKSVWNSSFSIGKAVVKSQKDPSVTWTKALAGLKKNDADIPAWKALTSTYTDPFLNSISKSNLTVAQRAQAGWSKGIKGTLRKFNTTKGRVQQGVAIGLSAVVNGISNYSEYKNGEITAERAVAETVSETTVDWGKNLLLTAAVTAGFAAVGVTAPALVVGATAAGISVAADWVCEKVTQKSVTELVSDTILDTAESVEKAKWRVISSGWNLAVNGAKNPLYKFVQFA